MPVAGQLLDISPQKGMISVRSTAMVQQLMPGVAYNSSQFNVFLLMFS